MSIETAPILVDNQMNFDPSAESTSMAEQTHAKPLKPVEAMIAKITHPPTTVPEFQGLPTQDARMQVVFNLRNIDVLKQPVVSDRTGGVLVNKPWSQASDYAIISPTGARVKWIGITYDTNATTPGYFEQDYNNVGIQDNFNFDTWSRTVNLYRPVAKSITAYANVTAFNNQGIVSCQQFNPNILFAGTVSSLSHSDTKLFHQFLDHKYEKKPELFSKDPLHPDFNHAAFESFFASRKIKPCGFGLDPDLFIQVIYMGAVGYEQDIASYVPTPSQMAQNSMRSYQDKFVNGAFAVQRLNTISPAWMAGSNTSTTTNNSGLYECYIALTQSDGKTSVIQLSENAGAGTSDLTPLKDTLWTKDMTWTMMRFQGIAPNPQFSSSQPDTVSPITIKTYYSIEAQPIWKGPWNGMSRVSPKPDLAAMQCLMDAFYEMPDAMPAKMNGLGSFLPFLGQIIPEAVKLIGGIFSKKKEKSRDDIPATTTKRETARQVKMPDNANLKQEIAKLKERLAQMSIQKSQQNRKQASSKRRNINRKKKNRQ